MVTYASFTAKEITHQLYACTGCQECLRACPTIVEPITINDLNYQTLTGSITTPVARFARACTQCGACVNVCPVGLRRDDMMLWLKMRLLHAPMEETISSRKRSLLWRAFRQLLAW